MGKVRIKTIGLEGQEREDKKKAQKRAEAKKVEAAKKLSSEDPEAESPRTPSEDGTAKPQQAEKVEAEKKQDERPAEKTATKDTKKSKYQAKKNKQKRSSKYLAVAKEIDKNKKYILSDALQLLSKVKLARFDETVELHVNTLESGISGNVTLPHGTGKKTRVEIASLSEDPKHVDELVKKIESGKIDFDVLIATPDTMPKLAKVARVLGPKGLMPNPKNGTVTPKPQDIAKKFEAGQVNFKTEAKFPVLHLSVGKLSFGEKKLEDNIKTAVTAIKAQNIKTITLKSTMSPGIKVDASSL